MARPHCLSLLRQLIRLAESFAFASAGSNKPARMAIIAMTTRSSMSVKPPFEPRHVTSSFRLSIRILLLMNHYRSAINTIAQGGSVSDRCLAARCCDIRQRDPIGGGDV